MKPSMYVFQLATKKVTDIKYRIPWFISISYYVI